MPIPAVGPQPHGLCIGSCESGLKHLAQTTLRGAYGIRTRAAAVRGRCPRPLDECARRGGSLADQIRSPITRRTSSREVIPFGAEAQSVLPSVVTPRASNEGRCSRPKEKKTPRGQAFFVEAAGLGFEPRLLGPEPSVLPLDDPATCRCGRGIVAEPGVAQAVPEMELVDAWPPENWHEGGCQATSAAQSPYSDV